MTIKLLSPKKFQTQILNWFDQHGRKNLPWQHDKTPYRVWISEIMLQQTQVSTVLPYYLRFMQRFPGIAALAEASEDEVLHLWTGLGYYSRARNLHRTAKAIFSLGYFPHEQSQLETLSGIGRSTAGAILSIAFEKKAAILDGNVKRVLTRVHGITTWPGEKKITEQLWSLAEKYTPEKRIADYTQAIMDLGATLCVRGAPKCEVCPLQKNCSAHLQGIEKTLPKKKPSVKIPTRTVTLLVLIKNFCHVLLEKRPTTGVWGGLWSLPEITDATTPEEIRRACFQRFKYKIKRIEIGKSFRHTFSHFHLEITPAFISVADNTAKIMEASQQIWYNLQQPDTVGLPLPVKNILTRVVK